MPGCNSWPTARTTGTTHLQDDGFDITVEIGKDVKWDAKGLTELVAKIEATGGDPREYVEIKYSVSEAKFKNWPQTLRAPFSQPAYRDAQSTEIRAAPDRGEGVMTTSSYSLHPAAELFPVMDDAAFAALVADIAAHGQREPILIHDGQVIDGRHRLRACEQIGIELMCATSATTLISAGLVVLAQSAPTPPD